MQVGTCPMSCNGKEQASISVSLPTVELIHEHSAH
jgi:hypothetical protein